jgi:hypothetical protein
VLAVAATSKSTFHRYRFMTLKQQQKSDRER